MPNRMPGMMRVGALAIAGVLAAALLPWVGYADGGPRGDDWYRQAPQRKAPEPPYRTQLDDSTYARADCGPAVLGMALDAYGINLDTLDLRRLTHTYQGTWPKVRVGTALQHMAHVAADYGVPSNGLYDADEAFHEWSVD